MPAMIQNSPGRTVQLMSSMTALSGYACEEIATPAISMIGVSGELALGFSCHGHASR